jgi:hypothetical protein
MAVQENSQSHQNDGREEDLKILSQWVRKELFVKVKFIYDVEAGRLGFEWKYLQPLP